jgi:two-component system, OmpR family, response regulator
MSLDTKSKVIIGVDDTPANLAILRATLVGAGYSFIGVDSGEECLRLVLCASPRLILLDIQMPGLDGLETCRRLRAIQEMTTVPIAFLTSRRTPIDVRMGMAAGGNDFIVKPFQATSLLDRVRHWSTTRVSPPVTNKLQHAS